MFAAILTWCDFDTPTSLLAVFTVVCCDVCHAAHSELSLRCNSASAQEPRDIITGYS